MEEKKYLRFAQKFFAGTLLSRCSGMARDMLMAFYFGAAPFIAHFFVGYRLVYLFRRIFGEGALQPSFVPQLQTLRNEGEEKAGLFFKEVFFSGTLVISLFLIFVEIGLLFVPTSPTLSMVQLMLPGVVFLYMYASASAFLQCYQKYLLSSVMPFVCNLLWIVSIIFAYYFTSIRSEILIGGVLAGFFIQAVIPAYKAFSLCKGFGSGVLFSAECRKLLRSLGWILIGVGAVQINMAIDTAFAQLSDESGSAFLWYALRLQQLPLALFGVAFFHALLPGISRKIAKGDTEAASSLLCSGIESVLLLTIPSAFLLYWLGPHLLDILFARGHFSIQDLLQTSECLKGYALGLVPMAINLIFSAALFAKGRYRTCAAISITSVLCNVFLNTLFIFRRQFGAESIAYATSISAFIQSGLYIWQLGDVYRVQRYLKSYLKYIAIGGSAFILSFSLMHWGIWIEPFEETGSFFQDVTAISIKGGSYFLFYAGLCQILGVKRFLKIFSLRKLT
jgi:putative peptidoglycan lipid II flippase